MNEAQAVVERQIVPKLPVVLEVGFVVARGVRALSPARELCVGTEDAEGGVRKPEAGIERVVRVVLEIDRAENRALSAPLITREVVIARLERVRAHHLGQA